VQENNNTEEENMQVIVVHRFVFKLMQRYSIFLNLQIQSEIILIIFVTNQNKTNYNYTISKQLPIN